MNFHETPRYRVRESVLTKLGIENPYPGVKIVSVLQGGRLDGEIQSALKRNPNFKGVRA